MEYVRGFHISPLLKTIQPSREKLVLDPLLKALNLVPIKNLYIMIDEKYNMIGIYDQIHIIG